MGAARETPELPGLLVAMSEHLLAMKVLSMRDARLQDRIDARAASVADTISSRDEAPLALHDAMLVMPKTPRTPLPTLVAAVELRHDGAV